MTITDVTMKPL